jgi:type II secretory pathway pseudopilin PulG
MAVAGLVMGYISLVLAVVMAVTMFASISLPVFSKIQERGNATKSINNVRQLITACRIYAADHEGAYPTSLDSLVTTGILEPEILAGLQRCPLSPDEPVSGYDYYGAGMKESDSPDAVVFMSKADVDGKRIIGYNDSSVMLAFPGGSNETETSQ